MTPLGWLLYAVVMVGMFWLMRSLVDGLPRWAMTPTLFDAPITAGTSRKRDRQTSTDAARLVRPARDQDRCLSALVANGGSGTIDTVCAAITDRDRGALSRRLTDLAQMDRIRDTGRSVRGTRGRAVAVWEVTR